MSATPQTLAWGLCLVMWAAAGLAADLPAVECRPRGGLPNVIARAEAGGEVRVAYLGGSITAAPGWRVKSRAWLAGRFPRASFTEINAAIGGTGSDLAAFRVGQDVIAHAPHLVFIEFAVNDGGASPEQIMATMEGIVRQILRADPATDICFVYTLSEPVLGDLAAGRCQRSAAAMEAVADHYAIPSVHFGVEVARRIAAGTLTFRGARPEPFDPTATPMLFSTDGVHPLVETGHELYAGVFARAFAQIAAESGAAAAHPLPEPLRGDNWEHARMLPITAEMLTGPWQRAEPERDPQAKAFDQRMPVLWKAEGSGATLRFRVRVPEAPGVKARRAAVYDLLGPGSGVVRVRVDGAEPRNVPRIDGYGTYWRIATLSLGDLAPGQHDIEVTLIDERPDKRSILFERNRGDTEANPGKYAPHAWYAAALLVFGDAGRIAGPPAAVDPLVEASAYRDRTVWSYHDKDPVPWRRFRPRDHGSSQVAFSGTGVRPVGRVPAPGVHPRIFFSPEDVPAIRRRIREDRAAGEAWRNVLAWSHALRLTYDEKAEYAQPDWANGGFHIHGRIVDLHRIGGYAPQREDYFRILAAGGRPATYEKTPPASFFNPAAVEAFRCLIDDDGEAARTLARATVTAVKLEQQRRAREDKPVAEGQPPKPSTNRLSACSLGFIYDFIHGWMTPEQRQIVHDELVTLSSGQDNYGTFNNAEASRSNWATFSYWAFDLMAIEGEPGFNDLKFLGLHRGWRNFYTYSFFDSGAAFEAEGKLLFGLDAAVAFDRVGHKYGLEPLTHHPLPRAYYTNFSARAMLPTRSSFAVFDILGSMGGGFTTPQDLVVARYLFPADKGIDIVYRALVGDDYRTLPSSLHHLSHAAITSAVFATAYDPAITPESAAIPLTFFCGQRALLMTRSSWDRDATMLTMHVRGASGGHPYPDRNGIMLAGQGRTWVTIPGKDIGGWAMNTVLVDGAEQNESTPGRIVDFADGPGATFATGDAKYSWDWVWRNAAKNKDGGPCTKEDVIAGTVDVPAGWRLVKQSFDDFAWTKSDREVYRRPLEFTASWIGLDGQLTPVIRQPNLPVMRSFRTAGLVRGPRPYVLVVDDVQRDTLPASYDWNLSLPGDVVQVRDAQAASRGDTIVAGRGSLDAAGRLAPGEPALLVRPLLMRGATTATVVERERLTLLTLRAVAVAPDYRMLLHAFRGGDPLPTTTWDAKHERLSVEFPDQHDTIRFAAAADGRTTVAVVRDGTTLARLDRPVPPLDDPASAELNRRQVAAADRFAAMRREGFDPATLPGFVAGWRFERPVEGCWPALPGSRPGTPAIPAANATEVPGPAGGLAARMPPEGVRAPVVLPMKSGDAFTVAFWTKTKSSPSMGTIIDLGGHGAVLMDVVQGGLRVSASRTWGVTSLPTATLSGWTHFAVTRSADELRLYRDGLPIATISVAGKPFTWGKEIRLGGTNGYGDAETAFADLAFYDRPLDPETIEKLVLFGRAPEARAIPASR